MAWNSLYIYKHWVLKFIFPFDQIKMMKVNYKSQIGLSAEKELFCLDVTQKVNVF